MILRKRPLVIAAVFTIIGLIIGLGISSNFNFHSKGYTDDLKISEESIELLSKTNQDNFVIQVMTMSSDRVRTKKIVKGGDK